MSRHEVAGSTRAPYGYAGTLSDVLHSDPDRIVGELAQHAAARSPWTSTEHQQIRVWTETLTWLRAAAGELISADPTAATWGLCLEYEIPRRGGRIDALLLVDGALFVIEFKATTADAAARRQAEDYGLELVDFHAESHEREVYPIVCAGGATSELGQLAENENVASPSLCPPDNLAQTILTLRAQVRPDNEPLDLETWLNAPYHPTPTIIEAAQALYAGHTIRELSQSEASADVLRRTQQAVLDTVERARTTNRNAICFITGIPGAGKTLAGLNVVHGLPEGHNATFLSGNGPLVKVLQAVLAKDLSERDSIPRSDAKRRASTLVTNVHRWLDDYVDRNPNQAPHEDVVVFDEAQRAWSRAHSLRKFGRDASEPEMMLEVMSRRQPSVVVGLVGGGQEINTGEAGLSEWGQALTGRFSDWDVVVSPQMTSGDLPAGSSLFPDPADVPKDRIRTDEDLHLAVTQRSFRSQRVSEWVEHVLAGRPNEASLAMEHLHRYPIVMTRDLEVARTWLRERTRGLRRCGLLASSGARRLRPDGITVREPVNEVDWFLRPPEDIRSSNFLELALTEFGVQGLEVDWAGLAWGGDLTRQEDEWVIRSLRGSTWRSVRSPTDRAYALNRYRVLLTRAREGMVIWIPPGHPDDSTRSPGPYQSVFNYLTECGVRTI